MYISRTILLLILAAYVFSPTVLGWMIDPGGAWYRPYLIWAGIVATSFLVQVRAPGNNEEEGL